MEGINSDGLQYFVTILKMASASYLGYAAFACGLIGFVLYLLSLRSGSGGLRPLNFIAYVLTLGFIGLLSFAAYNGSKNVQTIYYAGREHTVFNVGRFIKTGDETWEDWGLTSIYLEGTHIGDPMPNTYHLTYTVTQKIGDRLLLKRTVPNEAIIEIDFANRSVSWVADDTHVEPLYKIIALQ